MPTAFPVFVFRKAVLVLILSRTAIMVSRLSGTIFFDRINKPSGRFVEMTVFAQEIG